MSIVQTLETLDRSAWLQARRNGIGGSDAAAIVGLSPFVSAFELYLIKRGEAPDKPETEAQKWGQVLEAPIADEYARRTGRVLRPMGMTFSPTVPYMFANVDRVIEGDDRGPGVYEGKALSSFTKLDDGAPEHIWIQVQHYMSVTELTWADVAMLLGGQRFEVREISRDQEAIDMLIDAEGEFWARVRLGDPPRPDGMASTTALLKRMYPNDSGRTINLDGNEALTAAINACRLKREIKGLKKALGANENYLKTLMADATEAALPGWGCVTWKTTKPKPVEVIDVGLLKTQFPEAYKTCRTTKSKSPSRPLLLKPIAPEEDDTEDDTEE